MLWASFYSPKLQSSPMADEIGWQSRLGVIKWPRVLLLSLSPASGLRLAARVRKGCVAAKETWDGATAVMGGAREGGGRVTPRAWLLSDLVGPAGVLERVRSVDGAIMSPRRLHGAPIPISIL